MRIIDWSSDMCSSDLPARSDPAARSRVRNDAALSPRREHQALSIALPDGRIYARGSARARTGAAAPARRGARRPDTRRSADREARKRVVYGKGVSVRVDIGGGGIITQKKRTQT